MKNKINNLLAILCLIFVVSACNDEKPDDTEQSKPTASTDKRCPKDAEKGSEKNEEDEVDCVVVDKKKPDKSDDSNKPNTVDKKLLLKYLPKKCYKSVSSSGTIYAESWVFGEVNINNEKFTQFDTPDSARLEKNGTVTYRGETCSSSDLEIFFANKPGYVKSLSNCDSQSITFEMPPQGSALMSQRLYCEGYGDDFYNIKIVNYEGRDVLYAESTSPKGKSKIWHNLEPFHLIKRTSTWSVENGHGFNTWIWTDVKINEPIDDKVFALPKK